MYVECPHCHAIFALPARLGKKPEHVRCGECNTIFTPKSDDQTEDNSGSASQTPNEEPLSVSDFLSDSAANSLETDEVSEDNVSSNGNNENPMDQDAMESFQNYLDADNYPEEPEIELPDLNLGASATPFLDDPLKGYQTDDETETPDDIPETNQTVELQDNESSDLISDRLEEKADENDSLDLKPTNADDLNKTSLPDINEELITATNVVTEESPEAIQQKVIDTDIKGEDISDLAIDSYLGYNDDEEDKPSLTGEFKSFIDEVDDNPLDLFSADRADSEYEQQFLSLESETDSLPDEDFDEDNTSEPLELEDKSSADTEPSQSAEASDDDLLDIPPNMPAPTIEATEIPFSAAYNKLTWLYTLAGFFLLLTLSVQYLYFHREQFAAYPETRSLVTGLCKITGCSVSPLRDLSAIELLNHGIYSHPSTEKALIIKALIRNQAEFPQPYPTIELTLADLNDHKVALRRFGPGEYLSEQPSEESLMPVGKNIPVHLQVMDPGQEAVAFEFEFL